MSEVELLSETEKKHREERIKRWRGRDFNSDGKSFGREVNTKEKVGKRESVCTYVRVKEH